MEFENSNETPPEPLFICYQHYNLILHLHVR